MMQRNETKDKYILSALIVIFLFAALAIEMNGGSASAFNMCSSVITALTGGLLGIMRAETGLRKSDDGGKDETKQSTTTTTTAADADGLRSS